MQSILLCMNSTDRTDAFLKAKVRNYGMTTKKSKMRSRTGGRHPPSNFSANAIVPRGTFVPRKKLLESVLVNGGCGLLINCSTWNNRVVSSSTSHEPRARHIASTCTFFRGRCRLLSQQPIARSQ